MSRYLIAAFPFALAALAPVIAALMPESAPTPAAIAADPDPGFLLELRAHAMSGA